MDDPTSPITLALRPNPDPVRYRPIETGPTGAVRWLPGLGDGPDGVPGLRSLFTGVHLLDPALLDTLPAGPSDSVRDLYAPLVRAGAAIEGVRVRGTWYDLGNPALYLGSQVALLARGFHGAKRTVLMHGARVAPGARVRRSVVGAGARVGAGAIVEGSVLWEEARVGRGAVVRGSILAGGARVASGERVLGRIRIGHGASAVDVGVE